ncbi:MAG TPA: addiction module component, family protein [Planctomycetales bacterium]|jgi:putative addiction module component (TIGR02574 family)|nr:addiction module component, family protein [Planctomycetales bacterium]
MSPALETLYQAALALPEEERVELADRLLGTLSPDVPSQLHPAWRAELKRRSAQIEAGEVAPIPWNEVRRLGWEAVAEDEKTPHG